MLQLLTFVFLTSRCQFLKDPDSCVQSTKKFQSCFRLPQTALPATQTLVCSWDTGAALSASKAPICTPGKDDEGGTCTGCRHATSITGFVFLLSWWHLHGSSRVLVVSSHNDHHHNHNDNDDDFEDDNDDHNNKPSMTFSRHRNLF